RVLAMRDLKMPVKALIRDLDDEAAILAQGQENSARRDLSFIERVNFARQMVDAGYDRKVIGDALSTDKTLISRMLQVAEAVPVEVIERIGSAPGIGRDRWLAFSRAWTQTGWDTDHGIAMADAQLHDTSDARFEALLAWMEKHHKPKAPAAPKADKPRPKTLQAAPGKVLGTPPSAPPRYFCQDEGRRAGAVLAGRRMSGHDGFMARQMDYHTLREVFSRFRAAEAEPKGELNHVNAYTLVVAVALSAQATDAGVNKATAGLFAVADTPEKMLALGEEGLIDHIKTIGLFRNKAKNVIKLSRILVDQYGGEVPCSRAALESLPGVGRKTANVVLNMWWHYPAQAVDTHIFRVGNRTGICPGKDVVAVERAIEDNVPVDFQQHAHHWLILHGRYICVARKPKCKACLIKDLCPFEEKTA
ncbi:endonuclease III, partial [Sagittula stellata E-37]